MALRQHGFALLDELHLSSLRLQSLDAALQQLLAAAHAERIEKLAIRHVPEPVFIAVNAHKTLGFTVIGSHLFIGDRPLAIVLWTEPQAVPRPAQRASSDRLQPPVVGPVANSREVILLAESECRVTRPLSVEELLLDLPRHGVLPVIDTRAQRRTGFQQSGFEACFCESERRNTAPGAATDDANIECVHQR